MNAPNSDIAFTPTVKKAQEERGSRRNYARMEEKGGWRVEIDADLAAFIAERDSFYLGTANADGQPYIQHRGGKRGFLKVLGPTTLGIADFAGNRQYISLGNLADNPKAFIFLMDYANKRRIKIWGEARFVEGDEILEKRLADPDYPGRVERALVFEVKAWDVNCPQHITPRHDEEMLQMVNQKLLLRVAELEAENERLRGEPG
ncbi:MAG: pyridoxamine 5'-phosphate oxidase family protein [Minwuia sp.]|uniref:pyridoxamine 5'-phosphate oxidase family protein n=1 Tax=Minwuia sp. TaxID=2493630 RepID=UPI003A837E73